MPHREVLRHAGERVVDRLVAVGVVLTHDIAGDAGALLVIRPGTGAELAHAPQDPAVDRLQTVPDIGQSTPDDHAHRVVEEGSANLVF
jgi:hypothetical protein